MTKREPSLFDGRASFDPDGVIVGYEWDFGDGTGASGAAITHSYSEKGTYQVMLTVTDDGGLTDTDALIVIVD